MLADTSIMTPSRIRCLTQPAQFTHNYFGMGSLRDFKNGEPAQGRLPVFNYSMLIA